MTPKQKFDACVAIAPNFKVNVEFTTLPTVGRALVWRGRRLSELTERSAGIVFPEGNPFEPLFDELLTRALAELQSG